MGNCNCGSGTDTAVLTVESDVAAKKESCCGPDSSSNADAAGCCPDSDSCSVDCAPSSEVAAVEAVSVGNSSCC